MGVMNSKQVLLIATEYPPASSSSGVQRILKFSQHLPSQGWKVSVLTMHPMAYEEYSEVGQVENIPASVPVIRALAFNSSVHFSIKGRYLRFMALPDRWSSWVLFGFIAGIKRIRTQRPDVIFSSYPHASAHLLAFLLHKATSIPWVADFRDPMLYHNIDLDRWQTKVFQWLERKTIQSCQHAIFTTPGAITGYAKQKFSEYPEKKWHLISNAYDEDDFKLAEADYKASRIKSVGLDIIKPLVFVHAGLLYRVERDPTSFFKAISLLIKKGTVKSGEIKIILRAPGSEDYFQALIDKYELNLILYIEPKIPYQEVLIEMFAVDGLLLFQGALCNHQIPAKVYEYFRTKKPIFALTDSNGDTASLLASANIDSIAPLDDELLIAKQFALYIEQVRSGSAAIADDEFVDAQSRKARAIELADVLNLCNTE